MPNWIGDVVLAIPAIQSLRERYPNARITALVKPPSNELLSTHPAINTVITPTFTCDDGILDKMQFAIDLKKYEFDLAVVFPNSFRSAFMTRLTGAKVRLGYATEIRNFLLTDPVPTTKKSKTEYRVDYFFKILSPLGINKLEGRYYPFIPKEAYDTTNEHLFQMGIDKDEFLVTIHPSTSKPERSWHGERFAMLCQRLIKEYRAKILLLGSENDKPLLEEIKRCNPSGKVHAIHGLNLQESAAIIEKSKLFIGNDSGMMHLAAMVGTPIVGIFGPGSPATTGPFIDPQKKVTVSRNYPCSPCKQRFFKECKPSAHNKPDCIEDISVKEVVEAVENILHKLGRK
jgi:lipopolysaccharide heptosyltransferase II